MHTLHLKISDKIYDKVLWLLSKFSKDEIEVLSDDNNFITTQDYLKKELNDIVSEKASYYDIQEVEEKLDMIIDKYEDNL